MKTLYNRGKAAPETELSWEHNAWRQGFLRHCGRAVSGKKTKGTAQNEGRKKKRKCGVDQLGGGQY